MPIHCSIATLFRLLICAAALSSLVSLTGCERFLVPWCQLDDSIPCEKPTDAFLPTYDTSAPDLRIPDQIIPTRFDERANVALNDAGFTRKYVGMHGTTAVFLFATTTNPTDIKWQPISLALSDNDPNKRTFPGQCIACPTTFPGNKLDEFTIREAGKNFYFLKDKNKEIGYYSGEMPTVLNGITWRSPIPSPFMHPLLDSIILPTAITIFPCIHIFSNKTTGKLRYDITTANITAYTVGDLDAIDNANNGREFILFSGNSIHNLVHLDAVSYNDTDLIGSIQRAIDRTKAGDESPIQAAFVADLNKDGLPELIYVRSNQAFVTTYKGRNSQNGPQFEDWPNVLFKTSEPVLTTVATDINGDGYPELVVETALAVHFYLNLTGL